MRPSEPAPAPVIPAGRPYRESIFSSEAFLGAIARAHFPGKPWRVENVLVGGRAYAVLNAGGRIIDRLWSHPFFYEPLPAVPPGARPHPYLPRVVTGIVEAPAPGIAPPLRLAPFVDWRPFATFEEYRKAAHQGPYPATWKTAARSRRHMERELGPVLFTPHDPAPDALPTLCAWKDDQRRRTGLQPYFIYPPSVSVYHELLTAGLLEISTLRAGGRLLAGVLGYRWQGRYHGRLITRDARLDRLSPGTVLVHAVLQHSFEAGDEEFDFLEGAEAYKWQFSTHARVIASAGREPARQRIERRLRDTAGTLRLRVLERLPAARSTARG